MAENGPTKEKTAKGEANEERHGVILMLHGWAQNDRVFRSRTQNLTKKLNQASFECRFLQAPLLLPPLETAETQSAGRENARAWFVYNSDNVTDRSLSQTRQLLPYKGLDESLDLIRNELKNVPQHDRNFTIAILGFSQGAVLAHIIAALASKEDPACAFSRIDKYIFISGFPASPDAYSTELLFNIVDRPSLHLFGFKDTSVSPDLSRQLAKRFQHASILQHDKGHVMPQQSSVCSTIIKFLSGEQPGNCINV